MMREIEIDKHAAAEPTAPIARAEAGIARLSLLVGASALRVNRRIVVSRYSQLFPPPAAPVVGSLQHYKQFAQIC
jgi:hypothetical protein